MRWPLSEQLRSRLETWPVAVGVIGLVAGIQLVGLLSVLTLRYWTHPRWTHEPWFAAFALASAGAVLATSGTLRPSALRSLVTVRRPLTWAALVGGAFAFWGLGVWATPDGSRAEQIALLGIPIAQVVLIGAWAAWARPAIHGEQHPGLHPRTWGNLLIVTFLALSGATVALRLPDVYPFAQYQMYSVARLDPYTLERVVFEAVEEDEATRRLPSPASRQVLVDLVHDGEHDTLEGMAEGLRTTHDTTSVSVYLEEIGVAEHPAPPSIEVREREEVIVVER